MYRVVHPHHIPPLELCYHPLNFPPECFQSCPGLGYPPFFLYRFAFSRHFLSVQPHNTYSFCVWLLSLFMFLTFIFVITSFNSLFLFITHQYSIVYTVFSLSIHHLRDIWIAFQFLTIVNTAAKQTFIILCVHTFSFLLGRFLRVEMLIFMVRICLIF